MFSAPQYSPLAFAGLSTLTTCLLVACATDVASRRIPNRLVATTAATGLLFTLLGWSSTIGIVGAVGGMATGLAVWIPFYALGMLGAGDVKLFAAASAWLGPVGALRASAYTALIGGGIALALMLAQSGTGLTMLRVGNALRDPMALRQPVTPRTQRVPYALAIAAGVLGALWFPELL